MPTADRAVQSVEGGKDANVNQPEFVVDTHKFVANIQK